MSATFPEEAMQRITATLYNAAPDIPSVEPRKKREDRLRRARKREYARVGHEQNTLRKKGIGTAMLTEAFHSLGNVELLGVSGQDCDIAFPFGAYKIYRDTGMYPMSAEDSSMQCIGRSTWGEKASTWAFSVLLLAMAASGIKTDGLFYGPAQFIATIPKTPDSRSLSHVTARTLSEVHLEQLAPTFSRLRKLDFGFHKTYPSWKDHETTTSFMQQLLKVCPNVEELTCRGRVDTFLFSPCTRGFFRSWHVASVRGRYWNPNLRETPFEPISQPVFRQNFVSPKLRRLCIRGLIAPYESIVKIAMLHIATLQELELPEVLFHHRPLFSDEKNARVMAFFKENLPDLKIRLKVPDWWDNMGELFNGAAANL